jgi:hypothetical protein
LPYSDEIAYNSNLSAQILHLDLSIGESDMTTAITDVVRDPYQQLVDAQIIRFKRGFIPEMNPIESGVLYLAKDHPDDVPLWSLSFDKKPVLPVTENMYTLEITDENMLIALEIPRQYEAVVAEREIVLDHRNEEALIERLFYRMKQELGGGLTLVSATTVVRDHGFASEEFRGKLKVDAQVPDHTGISSGWEIDGTEVRPLLRDPRPVANPKL